MPMIMRILLIIHVVLGGVGLVAFWVPIFSRKGGPAHRLFGKVYKACAYTVFATAGLAVLLRAGWYLAEGHTLATRPEAFGFLLFLGYLALVTFVVVRHGVLVLQHKQDPRELGTPLSTWLARSAIAASAVVVAYAVLVSPTNKIILYALSPIGMLTGIGILRYISKPPQTPRAWMYEHLGSMIGGGIAFHTAFAVFGSTRLFDIGLDGWIGVIPWIAPAAIGIPGTILWTRHYRRKFGELA
ncbi:MAG: hypothetical protein KJO54_07685 [Gammaproteobacteria bacterium]|nr:hypothetical protein [Gammaproteobacteria bacterium]NNF61590.1 hypothetical protein [Gammaproteobacteria bacterium]